MIPLQKLDRLCLSILLIMILTSSFLMVRHLAGKRQQMGAENQVLSKRIKEITLATANLEDLKSVLGDTKKELNDLNERIPDTGKMGLFLQQLNALMVKKNIALVSLQPLSVSEEDNYLRLPIRLVFTGSYQDIYGMFYELENMNRIVVMENMEIVRIDTSGQCRADLQISVFERDKNT